MMLLNCVYKKGNGKCKVERKEEKKNLQKSKVKSQVNILVLLYQTTHCRVESHTFCFIFRYGNTKVAAVQLNSLSISSQ